MVIERIEEMYQRNHKAINLKYDVLGISSLKEERSATKTSRVVTVPTNLSEKFPISIKKVKQERAHNRMVGW